MKSKRWKTAAKCLWILFSLIDGTFGLQVKKNIPEVNNEITSLAHLNGSSIVNFNKESEEWIHRFGGNVTKLHTRNSFTVDRHHNRFRRSSNDEDSFITTSATGIKESDIKWYKLYFEEHANGVKKIQFSVKGKNNAFVTLKSNKEYPRVQVILNAWIYNIGQEGKSAVRFF
ncbi:unnamed protein product, partial [Meganyctiphanes norvegica]